MDNSLVSTTSFGPPDRPFLSRFEASTYLRQRWGLSRTVATLNTLACRKLGPRFVKAGRQPLYAPADLDAWAASLLHAPGIQTAA